MMDNKIFQLIFDELSKFLPNDWKKLVVYLEHGEDSYSYSFYVMTNKEYVKCFNLENVSEESIMKSFSKIEKAVSKERSHLSSEHKWSNMTMLVEATGKMKSFYDYTDLSKGTYAYKKEWKKRFLV